MSASSKRSNLNKEVLTWFGGIIAAVVSSLMVWWLTTRQPAMPPAAAAGLFAGSWVNENAFSGGITRVEIQQRLNQLHVHTWGKCVPQDCDHGSREVLVSSIKDRTFSIATDLSFKKEARELTLLPDGRLQLTSHNHFIDNSGRPDYDSSDYFKKQ
jgi:hypothetical protein